MPQPLWGIDLGGTKIEGVILESINHPEPILRTRIDTEASNGYDHIIKQIKKLVEEMQSLSGLKPKTIGFGTPGVLDPFLQTMKNCNSTSLNGRPLKRDIEAILQIPAVLANDANCFALAETHWGVVKQMAPGANMVFGIILGTGVGGGLVINGNVWSGCHGIGGEWGHIYLDDSGGPCYCGKVGCVETIISGPALEKYYLGISGKNLRLKEIVSLYHTGTDEHAKRTIDRLSHFFGKGVSIITNLLDPDVIVVGGGVGNIDTIYTDGVRYLQQYIFNNRLDVPILKPSLGDSAGVFGAAALVA
jgi:predicted NBD/HSP70 family sugar kinase